MQIKPKTEEPVEEPNVPTEVLEQQAAEGIQAEFKEDPTLDEAPEQLEEGEIPEELLPAANSVGVERKNSIQLSQPTDAMLGEMNIQKSENSDCKAMAIWWRGTAHVKAGTRCQDNAFCIGYDKEDPFYDKYVTNGNKIKVIMDGCGSCEYSLLGVLMLEEEFKRKAAEMKISPDNLEDVIRESFAKMLLFDSNIKFILDNYLFTILICFEYEDRYEVCTCGDGYIVYCCNQQVFLKELEGTEVNAEGKVLPNYFAYDLEGVKGKLANYKNGTEFSLYTFEKGKFSNVGVASDGLRFYSRLSDEDKMQLFGLIYYQLPIGLERLLEKNKRFFLDDFSIAI